MSETILFCAREIHTMDPTQPLATHVAVRDGRILAVGDATCADPWGGATPDDRLADAVLMPGFVEGHAHMMAGAIWDYTYTGFHDRADPDGRRWPGLADLDGVVDRLTRVAADLEGGAPLIGWGFDPIFLPGARLSRAHLDRISAERPIAILFSNFHLMCVNSAALALAGYGPHSDVPGVVMNGDGPTGELREMAAMFPVMRRLGIDFRGLSQGDAAIRAYGRVANGVGVTTVTDLYSQMQDDDLDAMLAATADPALPVRIVPALAASGDIDALVARAGALRDRSTDKLRLGAVKIMTDGSIQGWTARVKWPGYVGGQPNGLWNTAPDEIAALTQALHRAHIPMHVHVNGDEASEVVLSALAHAMADHPAPGLRHVLQHGQMMGPDQFRRCAELGVAVNLFSNHLWYFGDQHAELTIGPDRAARMNAARSALDHGLTLAIHSDAPVTPMGPLFTAQCATDRRTMSDRVLGAAQRITRAEALHAITLGAAATLGLDAEIGSIAPGKRADFAILGDDPMTAPALGDIPVLGTVFGGRVHRA